MKIECPTCGVVRLKPRPHVSSTPWTDDCACRDAEYCLAHRYGDDHPPKRPSEEEMLRRAEARCAALSAAFDEERQRFEEVAQLRKELDEARAEAEQLRVQLAGCSVAVTGSWDSQATKGQYGWSENYEDVLMLRRRFDEVRAERDEARATCERYKEALEQVLVDINDAHPRMGTLEGTRSAMEATEKMVLRVLVGVEWDR